MSDPACPKCGGPTRWNDWQRAWRCLNAVCGGGLWSTR